MCCVGHNSLAVQEEDVVAHSLRGNSIDIVVLGRLVLGEAGMAARSDAGCSAYARYGCFAVGAAGAGF